MSEMLYFFLVERNAVLQRSLSSENFSQSKWTKYLQQNPINTTFRDVIQENLGFYIYLFSFHSMTESKNHPTTTLIDARQHIPFLLKICSYDAESRSQVPRLSFPSGRSPTRSSSCLFLLILVFLVSTATLTVGSIGSCFTPCLRHNDLQIAGEGETQMAAEDLL